ncbi:MAG: LTA synthase family protein [Muribaculaceae bacterium]|nr:LTA synthase family protein [Muribaculaceae bacterium]
MKKAAIRLILTFIFFTAVCVLAKVAFMAVHWTLLGIDGVGDMCAVIGHGLSMDMSVAGYLTAIPALLIIAMLCTDRQWPRLAMRVYMAVAAVLLSMIFILDTVLYGYWGSKLDTTPIFYFTSSPAAAMASAAWWESALLFAAVALVAIAIYLLYTVTTGRIAVPATRRSRDIALLAIFTALLFIPIRGSVTVSTMNPSRAYFSQRRSLNHAALNPAFNLLYSATHSNGYGRRYRFMPSEDAAALFAEMKGLSAPGDTAATDSKQSHKDIRKTLLRTDRPEIVLVILESFSSYLMPSLGGDSVAVGLDSIARNGLLFSNIYASGNRTDRALPAILSAIPSQPGESVLKYPEKIEHLPSLAATLAREGYESAYFYGGDANFTNMQAYLMNMGFGHTVSDRDFAISEKASKWGAPDHLVFARAADYLLGTDSGANNNGAVTSDPAAHTTAQPRFTVIQTSSSHEPFDVPYHNARFEAGTPLNAFAYTDSCTTAFVNTLCRSDRWDNMLVVLVPDHYGCWPKNLPDMPARYRIPLIMTGGAIALSGIDSTLGSQTDITATILSAMKLPADEFPFSADLLNRPASLPVYMAAPGDVSIVTPDGSLTWNCDADAIEAGTGTAPSISTVRAYLQSLFEYLSTL